MSANKDSEPQAQGGEPLPVWNFGSYHGDDNGIVIVTGLGSQHPETTNQFVTLQSHREAMANVRRANIEAKMMWDMLKADYDEQREAIDKKDAALKAIDDAIDLMLECGTPETASLYDEEGIEGWCWKHPNGREWCAIGAWDKDPPLFPPLDDAITVAKKA